MSNQLVKYVNDSNTNFLEHQICLENSGVEAVRLLQNGIHWKLKKLPVSDFTIQKLTAI